VYLGLYSKGRAELLEGLVRRKTCVSLSAKSCLEELPAGPLRRLVSFTGRSWWAATPCPLSEIRSGRAGRALRGVTHNSHEPCADRRTHTAALVCKRDSREGRSSEESEMKSVSSEVQVESGGHLQSEDVPPSGVRWSICVDMLTSGERRMK